MRLRFWLGAALAALLAVAGVQGIAHATGSTGDTERADVERHDPGKFTPLEYFEGIYFGLGPVGDKLGDLHPNYTPDELRDMQRMAKDIHPLVEQHYPGFTERLAQVVHTGDLISTRETLASGMRLGGEAYYQLYDDAPPPGCAQERLCDVDLRYPKREITKDKAGAIKIHTSFYGQPNDLIIFEDDTLLYFDQFTQHVLDTFTHPHH